MLKNNSIIRYAGITVMAFVIIAVYALFAFNLKVFSPVAKAIGDYSFEDFYYQILSTSDDVDTNRVVTIVDMTELISRRDLANTISEISALKPKVLGVDIVFEGLKEDTIGDQMLQEIVCQSNAIFAYKIIDRTGEEVHSFFMPNDSLAEAYVNMPRQLYGGLKRNLSIGRMNNGKLYPSFIKKVADRYAGEEVMPLSDKEIRINFTPTHFEVIKYSDVMMHPELIEDRVVLLGAMREETDMHYTPLGKIAGTELLAYGINTMLKHDDVKVVSGWPMWLISFIVVMLITFVRVQYLEFAKRRKIFVRAILSLGLAVGLVVFSVVAVLMWIAFILFCQYNISFNLGYAIAASAVIPSAINLYDTIVNYKSEQ